MATETQIAHPPIVSPEVWRAKRVEFLAKEKELTKHKDRVNAERRRLPMAKIDKEYVFETTDGRRSLLELFGGQRQLIVYHFMFDPEWDQGCPGCTSYVDAIGDLSDLEKKDTKFVLVSRAPLEKLQKFMREKGWNREWVSSYGSDFNYDFHVTNDESVAPFEYNYKTKEELIATGVPYETAGEEHGTSVFFRIGNDVYHTYSNYGRGTEGTADAVGLLDLTPYGRQEDFEDSPVGWPQKPTYG